MPQKEDFHSQLNVENITDAEYELPKRVCKDFEKKVKKVSWFVCSKQYIIVGSCISKLSKYLSWNFEFDTVHSLTASGLVWQADFKKTKVK